MRGRPIRTILLLLLSLAIASCNTRQRIGGAAVGVTVVGLGLTYSNDSRSDEEVGTQGKVGITMILVGLVTLFVVAAIDESASENESKPKEIKIATTGTSEVQRQEQQAAQTAQQRRAQAWELTKQAQTAARANDCAKVTELSAQVGALDADFYAELFLKDIAIQKCLQPAAPPPPTTPPPALPPPTIAPATP